MFKKILIANRGEIAVRVITAAKEMGIKTVAVYSDFDKFSMFARIADEAYHLGPSPAAQSYLLGEKIIEIAKRTGCEAIHPGYGFLSERPIFAKLCEDNKIKFIGPSSSAIEFLGSKTNAKDIAVKANVPTVPGMHGALKDLNHAIEVSSQIGFPILLKASAGGGGKGMRVVRELSELESSYRQAKSESLASFGDDSVFIEKYLEEPRHIEFQILADEHGNVVHLGERECSMQRRHQKIIEESPSVILDEKLRKEMGECAKRIALEANYSNAGTVEFILDKNKNFYFLEVNTRLQVEHPVTEVRTGLDLVKEQFKIAFGEKLSVTQEDIIPKGHSIECRICAEDSDNNFMPSTGKIGYIQKILGNGIREDSGVEAGDEISVYYDPMISKLICFAETREAAIEKMSRVLNEYSITGIKTNSGFLLELLNCKEFKSGNYNTQFIEKEFLNRKSESLDQESELAIALSSVLFKNNNVGQSSGKPIIQTKNTEWQKKKFNSYR